MIFSKKISALAAALMIITSLNTAAAPISVKLDALGNNYAEYVEFASAQPVVIDDTTMVPVRDFAKKAGMDIEWDQTTLTALVSIDVTKTDDLPIIKYGKALMEKVSDYGLDITPKKLCASLQANNQNCTMRYVFTDKDGDEVCIGKNIDMGSAPRFIDGDILVTPLRATASIFGLDVEWFGDIKTVEVSIPDVIVAPMNVKIIPQHQPKPVVQTVSKTVEKDDPVPQQTQGGDKYLGRFKLTHYCACSKCCGKWGGNTAWAGRLVPNQTIAVDPNVIPKLSWVYIDGYGLRRAEDTGGAIKGNRIDVAVSSHSEALRLGVVYKDLWLKQ